MIDKNQLKPYLDALNDELRLVVDRFFPGPPELGVMLRYHLGWVDEQGNPASVYAGKQFRPLFLLLCAEAAGGDWRQALPAAAAVELVHNFSLIHDDIEDRSPLRRGRPTLWSIWGEASAINAGDAMFALAHRALLRLAECGVSSARVLRAVEMFEETNLELTRGQHSDMAFESRPEVSVEEYLEMVRGKTAALISLCARLGAWVAGCGDERVAQFAELGLSLGMAFQVRDDILGIWGEPEVTGKSAATDIVSRKKSLPVLYGLGRSSDFRDVFGRAEVLDEGDVGLAVGFLDEVDARGFAEGVELRYVNRASVLFSELLGEGSLLSVLISSLAGRAF